MLSPYLCYELYNHLLQGLSNFACDTRQATANGVFKIQVSVSHAAGPL